MTKGERGEWVIDVCLTCGKHAVYPFCEHRDERSFITAPSLWTEPVVVRGTWHRRAAAPKGGPRAMTECYVCGFTGATVVVDTTPPMMAHERCAARTGLAAEPREDPR